MAESVVLKAGTATALTLTSEAAGFTVVEHAYPAPNPRPVFASSADTEGSRFLSTEYENREITLTVEALTEAALVSLTATVAHIGREGGTLTYTTPGNKAVIFDLLTWQSYEPALDIQWSVGSRSRVALRFAAKPFGRGTEVSLTDHAETTAPAVVFTEASISGDVPALGRLVIDEDQAADQAWVIWGQRSRRYSADASAALLIKAEDMTTQGGSTKTTGATGAYGTNVVRNTDLSPTYASVISGQLSASSTYLSHIGTYRVFARVYCPTGNTGTVNLALEWAEGDFRRATRNTAQEFETAWEGSWRLFDLGVVSLREVVRGTQRWEPRIIAKSTVVGDEIDVDWLMFVPVDEGSGTASSVTQFTALTGYSARDGFAQSAGALTGKTLPVGGTWTGAGDADDFAVTGSGTVQRTAVSDSGPDVRSGRLVTASGTTALTTSAAQVDVTTDWDWQQSGVLLRYVDSNNFLAAVTSRTDDSFSIQISITGSVSTIAYVDLPTTLPHSDRIFAQVSAGGVVTATRAPIGGAATHTLTAHHAALATGGTLAAGAVGIVDWRALATPAATRTFDNFTAWVPSLDAAVFASQSLEVRHDGAFREDSAGAIWTTVSSYEGDNLLVPPSGPEGRTVQVIVKPSRNVPGQGADSATDDVSAQLHVTPRYLVVPS